MKTRWGYFFQGILRTDKLEIRSLQILIREQKRHADECKSGEQFFRIWIWIGYVNPHPGRQKLPTTKGDEMSCFVF
jgi:hypothetical protein